MTEKMIPLSVIDALMTSVEDFGENYRYHEVIELLEDLKKEAIPSPLEQKINARIKEVEPMIGEWTKKQFIDELRKLLK